MSSKYPILDNRPIDQWKVTELKEELKRRKLPLRGLKDDLIKRLDEALCLERETAEKDSTNGFDCNSLPVVEGQDFETVPAETVDTVEERSAVTVEKADGENPEKIKDDNVVEGNAETNEKVEGENPETIKDAVSHETKKDEQVDDAMAQVDSNNGALSRDQEKNEHEEFPVVSDSASAGEKLVVHATKVETCIRVAESVVSEVIDAPEGSHETEIKKESRDSMTKLEYEDSKPQLENEGSKPQLECDTKPLCKDALPDSSAPENQVSEVNPVLGSQVKSDSICTDSVSINEKIELKDNIIADNVKLEQDIVRPEMVEPSSSNVAPVFGESHSMDVEEPHEKNESVEEKVGNATTSPDLIKNNNSDYVGYSEKLNLDRSSGDDSMEEDLLESKQIDSKDNSGELGDKEEQGGRLIVKEKRSDDVVGDVSSEEKKNNIRLNNSNPPAVPAEKRKLDVQATVGDNEPVKRQRKWNSEAVKASDPHGPDPAPSTMPKDIPTIQKRNFSRSDSSVSEDAPTERVVPPSQKPPTNSLRVDRFLRPFTLKAVQELLGKTGRVVTFWMDQIKTHCYVTYSSVEEAIETRNAVYNLQWPPNGGRLLLAEFVDPREVKMKSEAPPIQATPVNSGPVVPPTLPSSQPEPSPRHQRHQQLPSPPTLPPPPPLSSVPPVARERLPSPPPLPEKVDPPIVTLDDLFCKTKATPRIYYLPLSEEKVAAKLAMQGKTNRQ